MPIYNLPTHIFFLIRDFVFLPDFYRNHDQYDGEHSLNFSLFALAPLRPEFKHASPQSWRNFVNANKKDFSEIKRLTVYYDLRDSASRGLLGMTLTASLFGPEPSFPTIGTNVKNLNVANINQQVTPGLVLKAKSLPEIFSVSPGKLVEPPEVPQIPFPFERLTIELQEMGGGGGLFGNAGGGGGGLFGGSNTSETFQISLKSFPFVKNLTIRNRNGIDAKSTTGPILKIHISEAMQLHSFVTNIRCIFVDESNTPQLFKHLSLCSMPQVGALTDTTLGLMLGSLQKVNLSYSKGLSDVSSLRHVHTLSLKGCDQVEDVSMLGEVYSLNISDCPRILSINGLGKVKKLSIQGLKELRDGLPMDNEVKELWVDSETYVRAGVPEFKDHNKRINIFSKGLFGQPPETQLYSHIPFAKVYISRQDLRKNCDLSGMRELVMEDCKLPSEFTPMLFPELRRLVLLTCEGVERIAFDRLPGLKVLKINGCFALKTVTIEHELEVFELMAKAEVINVTIRAAVKALIIKGCSSLKLLDVMAPVGVYELSGLKNCRVFHHRF